MLNRCHSRGKCPALLSRSSAARKKRLTSLRFPQLDGIALGIVQAREAAVWICLGIDTHFNVLRAELCDHRVEIAHAEIDHPLLLHVAEVFGVVRERAEDSRAGFL